MALTKADPFTQVLQHIWAKLVAHTAFAALVQVGNRIYLDGSTKREPEKDQMSTDDYPQVRIYPGGSEINLWAMNEWAVIEQDYVIEALCEDQRVYKASKPTIFPLRMYILDALHSLKDGAAITEDTTDYTWSLRRGLKITGSAIEREDQYQGWQELFTVTATIQIARASLTA